MKLKIPQPDFYMQLSKILKFIPLFVIISLVFIGCNSMPEAIPRPKGWPRIDLPAHEYKTFSNGTCPFTFEYPKVATIEKQREDSCWADFFFPQFEARWHITYRDVPESGKTWAQHYEEYRKLVYKHIQKVSQIKETPLQFGESRGTMFELFGTVGVPAQMIYGDSLNIVMVSFYFDEAIRDDSLSPVINFLKEDMQHLAQSVKWAE